ncbi:MAG: three-Cys-motif partner protein TcmP [Anaerolineae bacterium]|nr:three-Cys-motif partner protein TcmP [Anaerolineae bacterium]
MDKPYLEAQDDGLLMRPMKDWAAEKLDYLERYLDMFTTAMRNKKWRALNYIDLFAGPGKCQHENNNNVQLGSPLLALTRKKAFDHYFFIDLDPDNIQALQQRCSQSPYADRIQYFRKDCNEAVHCITEEIQRINKRYIEDLWPCLNLAFLDPEGLELDWETVETLAQLRTDLVIHYSQMGLQRYMPIAIEDPNETSIDRFFGCRDWRNIYKQSQDNSRAYGELLNLYQRNLYNLGYKGKDEVGRLPLMRNTKNAPLYYLVYASKSDLGKKFWHEVTKRNVYGQQRLF